MKNHRLCRWVPFEKAQVVLPIVILAFVLIISHTSLCMADTGCLHGMLSTPFGRGESGTRVFGLSRITKPIDGSLFMGTWRGLLRKTIPVCDEVSVPTQGVWSNIARKFAGLEEKAPVAMYVSPRIEACCLDCLRIPRNLCRHNASSGIGSRQESRD